MLLEGNSTYHGELGLGQADLIETNKNIKASQLKGIEYDGKMFTLVATNMILRGVYIIIRLSFLIVKL